MGVMNANNPEIVKQAYEAGVRFFDTAEGYQGGNNEKMIGSVFESLGVRDKVIIQTKLRYPGGGRRQAAAKAPQMSDGAIRDALLKSSAGCLERLQTDCIDILMLHQPTVEQMNNEGAVEALTKIKEENKARYVGVSTHADQANVLNNAAKTGFYDVAVTSFNCSMGGDQALLDGIRNAAQSGVGVIAMKTQLKGRQYQDWGPINHPAVLKWVLQNESITTAIPGYTNFEQLNQSFSVAYDIQFTPEEELYLQENKVHFASEFCRQCGECRASCFKGVDVPTLMRVHMYAACYSNLYQARATLDEIVEEESLKNCVGCATCSIKCINGIDIAANLSELRATYL
jgi:aryl-alcohol dehydrogenase-like predicted oxidoreductase